MATSRVTRWFERVDQREFIWCQIVNQALRSSWLYNYFRWVSRLGDGWLWYALILALPWLAPEGGAGIALLLASCGITCTLVYKLLKRYLVRERPFISFPVIDCGIPPLDRYSFPSGHTLHAVCFTLLLALTVPELAVLVLPFTLSVAASRVVLGLHYPSDVLAGAIIGSGLGLLGYSLLAGVLLV
ncbi:MAG: phosphatase PAP2 family protein [Pseudomonadaceae bacterium]|nr:MAG: phosphatase PAP2 family protein [Pseudomonadaceae bacterium]